MWATHDGDATLDSKITGLSAPDLEGTSDQYLLLCFLHELTDINWTTQPPLRPWKAFLEGGHLTEEKIKRYVSVSFEIFAAIITRIELHPLKVIELGAHLAQEFSLQSMYLVAGGHLTEKKNAAIKTFQFGTYQVSGWRGGQRINACLVHKIPRVETCTRLKRYTLRSP